MKNPFVWLLQTRTGYRIESFIVGWYKTLEIKFRYPDLHKALCSCVDTAFDEDDFVEAERHGYPRTYIFGSADELDREQLDGEDL